MEKQDTIPERTTIKLRRTFALPPSKLKIVNKKRTRLEVIDKDKKDAR